MIFSKQFYKPPTILLNDFNFKNNQYNPPIK